MRRYGFAVVGSLALLMGCNGRVSEQKPVAATVVARTAVEQKPMATTVCAIVKDPAAFSGRVVKLRATVFVAFEVSVIGGAGQNCKGGMWFAIAREEKDQSSEWDEREAELQKQQPVFLRKDDGFKRFDEALSARVYPRHSSGCMSCSLYSVTATMVGRVDYSGEQPYFGQMNEWKLQFVMASVSDVSTVENKYNWSKFSRTPMPR